MCVVCVVVIPFGLGVVLHLYFDTTLNIGRTNRRHEAGFFFSWSHRRVENSNLESSFSQNFKVVFQNKLRSHHPPVALLVK